MKKIISIAFCYLLILQLALCRLCYKRIKSRIFKKTDVKFFVNGKEYSSDFLMKSSNDHHNFGKISTKYVMNDDKNSITRNVKNQSKAFQVSKSEFENNFDDSDFEALRDFFIKVFRLKNL